MTDSASEAIAVALIPSLWVEGGCVGTPVYLGVVETVDIDEDEGFNGNLVGLVTVGDADRAVTRCFEKNCRRGIQAEGFEL